MNISKEEDVQFAKLDALIAQVRFAREIFPSRIYLAGSGWCEIEKPSGRLSGTNKHAVQLAARRMMRRGVFQYRSKIYNNVRAYGGGRLPDYSYSCTFFKRRPS